MKLINSLYKKKIYEFICLVNRIDNNLYFNYYINLKLYLRKLFLKEEFKADILVISFPKCGRTWFRTILGKYFEKYYGIPFSLDFKYSKSNIPSLIFSHSLFFLKLYKTKKTVFLIRDPRDVVVSYYYHYSKRKNFYSGTLHSFLRSTWGIKSIIKYNNNIYHYFQYNHDNTIIVRYEDLRKNTFFVMESILKQLNIPVDEKLLRESIEFCEFSKMQKYEKENKFADKRLKAVDPKDTETFKVRKGKVGGYKQEMDSQDIEFVNKLIQKDKFYSN